MPRLYTPAVLANRRSQRFLSALANSRRASDVADASIDGLGQIFDATIRGVFFFDVALRTVETAISGMSDVDFDEYEREWRPKDRVLAQMLERQVPMHNAQIYSEHQLKTDPLYADYGRRVRVYRYMCAPLYGSRAELQGMLRVCRGPEGAPFGPSDLTLMTALGGYISSALARVRAPALPAREDGAPTLTCRELEIARLAASGRNNRQIAQHLGLARETIKQTLRRVYQKFGVRCRAEMAVRLARQMLV
jgi:DNA-binding CsgD family transcriptional regulator